MFVYKQGGDSGGGLTDTLTTTEKSKENCPENFTFEVASQILETTFK